MSWMPPTGPGGMPPGGPPFMPMYGSPMPPPAAGAAPVVWQSHTNADGKMYWFNTITKQSTWEKPEELKTPLEIALASLPWKEYTTKEGKKYYSNSETKKTVWEMPPEYKAIVDANDNGAQTADGEGSGALVVAQPIQQKVLVASAYTKRTAAALAAEEIEYKTKEDAETAFRKLLEETGVKPNWTWEQTMRAIISNPRYNALKTLQERKSAFMQFVEEKRVKEENDFKAKMDRSRNDFLELMKNHKEVTSNTRWRKIVELFGNEECFKFLGAGTCETLYENHVTELRRREKEDQRVRRKENMEKFRNLLSNLPITVKTTWKEGQEMYTKSMDYKLDSKLQTSLDPIDHLSIFEDHIKQLETDYFNSIQKRRDAQRREERKAREGFRDLLRELVKRGELHSRSKWKEVYPLIKDDERYKRVLDDVGAGGSEPLEMLWDVLCQLDEEYLRARGVAMDMVKQMDISVTPGSSFSLFAAKFSEDQVAAIGEAHLKMVFEELQQRAAEKNDEEKKRQERKVRKRMDSFRHILKRMDPPVGMNDSWESFRSRVSGKPEYIALEEPQAEAAFAIYIEKLKDLRAERSESEDEEDRRKSSRRKEKDRDRERERDRERDRGSGSNRKKHRRHHRDSGAESGSDAGGDRDRKRRKRSRRSDDEDERPKRGSTASAAAETKMDVVPDPVYRGDDSEEEGEVRG
ncbi:hypothetical protein BJ742DRAFT_805967 [Cladochytrium replicatum]|nr:hypothetical protein BJ742DRAFT_805967 [Cladochytrium replicatum]